MMENLELGIQRSLKDMNIDTSLTGDTDGLGYYFDADKNGNIFVTK